MEYRGKTKITKHAARANYVYPRVRLPEQYAELIGETTYIFEDTYNGKKVFVLAFDEDFDGEVLDNKTPDVAQLLDLFVQLQSTANVTSQISVLEQKVETILEALKDVGGPDEIRTHDPRRVKAMS